MPAARFFDANTTDWTPHPRFASIRTKLFETRDTHPWASVMVVEVAVAEGIATHIHPTETETAYFLAGEGLFIHGDQEMPVKAGMAVSIPPGLPHSLRNTGEAPLEILAMHMPPIQ
jgi:mannose-6-phosphate isomerase-like protein (cupin superfamily)